MATTYFHPGDLSSGITLAIQQDKFVACFIRSADDARSSDWEDEWLPSTAYAEYSSVAEAIASKAVLLRIEYGSPEAGFLNSFCPVTAAPSLIIIKNGRVVEQLESDIDKEEFTGRVALALGLDGTHVADGRQGGPAQDAPERSLPARDSAVYVAPPSIAPTSAPLSNSQPAPEPASNPPPPNDLSATLAERASRLSAEKLRREAADTAERKARSDARRKEAEDAHAAHKDKGKQRATSPSDGGEQTRARRDWIYAQKQLKDEAQKEKKRILAQIESDRQERRARSERQKQVDGGAESEPMKRGAMAASKRSVGAGGTCALQIRLFDGTSVRGRFPVDNTLNDGVRKWIKDQSPPGSGGADIPYNFRQILAPQPSRSIEMSEENMTLADLGLVPNATLVLVAVAGYTDAYASSQDQGGVLGWAYGMYNMVPRFNGLSRLAKGLYMGGTGDAQEQSNIAGASMASENALVEQRIAEKKEKDKPEFYNGNSLGLEGRKDDDEGRSK